MLQLEREYLGFTLNTATSDVQTKKTTDAHGINKQKNWSFAVSCSSGCFIILFILLLHEIHKQCLPLQPTKAMPVSYSGALYISGTTCTLWEALAPGFTISAGFHRISDYTGKWISVRKVRDFGFKFKNMKVKLWSKNEIRNSKNEIVNPGSTSAP